MVRSSRSSSGRSTAAPNHHQRIMIFALSGGFTNAFRRAPISSGPCHAAATIARQGVARKKMREMLTSTRRADSPHPHPRTDEREIGDEYVAAERYQHRFRHAQPLRKQSHQRRENRSADNRHHNQ